MRFLISVPVCHRMTNDDSGYGIKSIRTAFDIIRFVEAESGTTIADVGEKLDLPKSTAHIYLKTLHEEGYLVRDGRTYRTGFRFLEHGGIARREYDIYRVARQEVDKLAAVTGEVANFGVEERGFRVLIYKSEGSEGIYDNPPVGQFTHMHWTALGKALLSDLSKERVDEIVERHGLPVGTPNTITDRDTLFAEIEQIREQDYSVEDEERKKDIRAIGVPIRTDSDDGTIGAISVSGPQSRIDESQLVDDVQNSANVIRLRYEHY